ncbi:MAG: apolipoprotein N-acyltransferase [Bacteroidetes bacterium]|nr:apolipoprotein N-acyltransferase [Bacteroidota bacterium]
MKYNLLSRPIFLSLISGCLAGLAWPGISPLFFLIFFAFVPMLLMEQRFLKEGGTSRRIFFPAFVGFLFWNIIVSYFIFCIRDPYAESAAMELLSKTVASGLTYVLNASFMAIVFWLFHLTRKRLGDTPGYVGLIMYWMSLEYLHMHWSINWPWLNLGNVFANQVALVQWYSITGSPGGTLWILLVNVLIFQAIQSYVTKKRGLGSFVLPALAILVPVAIGLWQFKSYEEKGEEVERVLIQPNLDPYDEKFDSDPLQQLMRMIHLADSADSPHTRWYILPETAIQEYATVRGSKGAPVFYGPWEHTYDASESAYLISSFLKDKEAVFLAGVADRAIYQEKESTSARYIEPLDLYYESFNSTLLIGKEGIEENYHKSKLVPGVESIPFTTVLSFLDDLALDLGGASGSLGVQDSVEVFRFDGHALAPTICYESVFGEYTAQFVRKGADCLAISTNDSWWQDSPGYIQLLAYARLRAVETRRSIARSANSGISCFIDQRGMITSSLPWWTEGALRGTVRMNSEITPYVQHGDYLSRIAALFSCLILLWSFTRRFKAV